MKIFSTSKLNSPFSFEGLLVNSLIAGAIISAASLAFSAHHLVTLKDLVFFTIIWIITSLALWCYVSLGIKDQLKTEALFKEISSRLDDIKDAYLADTYGGTTVLAIETKCGKKYTFFEGLRAIEAFSRLKQSASF